MGVMDYTPNSYNEDSEEAINQPSLCMIWNKLLELEELLRNLKQEIRNKTP